ncbi:MAG: hypoxanthine phosphoribosyltransferase [Candidatus Hydrogenedentota bacterium]
MQLSKEPFITADALDTRIRELATEVDAAFSQTTPVLLTVLKGAKPFAESLAKKLTITFDTGTIQARSYEGTESTGNVEIDFNSKATVAGRHVLLIEDILDTGRTAAALIEHIQAHKPASLKIVSLLDKPSRRIEAVNADWVGFTIEDLFVVGFGMDYNQNFRDLDDIRILEP